MTGAPADCCGFRHSGHVFGCISIVIHACGLGWVESGLDRGHEGSDDSIRDTFCIRL